MKQNIRIFNRFTGYTTRDCDCKYCLFKGTKDRPCRLATCCCAEDRQTALEREQIANNGLTPQMGW